MNKAKELFDKILVDGQKIDLQALDANNGVYTANEQKTLKVDFVLKKKDEIPAKIFTGLTSLKSVVVPESVKTIGAQAFANTGAEVSGLEQVETFGEGALVGTVIDDDIKGQISGDAFIERYTAAEAAIYNLTLDGALHYGDIKVPGQEAQPEHWVLNGQTYNEDPTYEESQAYDFIKDETSWNTSYTSGVLKKYYPRYDAASPYKEDLWNPVENRPANWNDIVKENGSPVEFEDGYHYVDSNGDPCIRCWLGAVNAPDARYPWIAPYFDGRDITVKIRFEYEDKEAVYPWGDKVFGDGDGRKLWGAASVAEEFKDKGFLLDPENSDLSKFSQDFKQNSQMDSWVGNAGDDNFDINKFKLILEHQNVEHFEASEAIAAIIYTKEEVDAYNAQLTGAIKAGDIKDEFAKYILIDSLNKFNEIKTNSTTSEILINNSAIINGIGDSAEYFKSIKVTGVDINSTVTIKTLDKIILDNITVSGEKGVRNGKITFATNSLELKNISVSKDSTIYNAFEGYQSLNDLNYTGIKQVTVKNMHIDCPSITHNIVNIYTPGEGCEILFKDCTFNLDVNNSNIIRLANYMNSSNVHVTFENVEWNYEEAANEQSDWKWAGLVIYQPASADTVLSGDTSKLATWTFTFKDCKYNGQIVTANNFGQHNQVVYLYNVGSSKAVSDPTLIEGMTFNFINSENIVNGEVISENDGNTQIYNG